MSLVNRNLITIEDLSNQEIEAVFTLADEMSGSMKEQSNVCQGKIMASLFFEPSTRTRLSFEAGMHRLGGEVINAVDVNATSLSKGESIADMARVVGSYADIIVIRHPWEGAAKVVAEYADVPVVNAGDGGHEHPTQTLCDLYTLKKEKQTLRGLNVALLGDLKYGRTVHSLVYALARFGAVVNFQQRPGREMPEYVLRKLTEEYGLELRRYEYENGVGYEEGLSPFDAIYISPRGERQLPMEMPDITIRIEVTKGGDEIEVRKKVDALYVTRRQKERLKLAEEIDQLEKVDPMVDKKLLKEKEFRKAILMHPLPRVDELAYEMDADPRSMYFKQAARGVPIRMALISLLLGAREVEIPDRITPAFVRKVEHPFYSRHFGVRCENDRCVTYRESGKRYIEPVFQMVSNDPLTLRCVYCEHEINPRYIASSKWHTGMLENKRYYSANSFMLGRIQPENLIIFGSEEEALAWAFKPGKKALLR